MKCLASNAMNHQARPRFFPWVLLLVGAASASSIASAQQASSASAIAKARADSARYAYTNADIQFMSGMIGHHAQAIVMSNLVPTRSSNNTVRTLAERIIASQRDEIFAMQRWLRDRQLPVPDTLSGTMIMNGRPMTMSTGGHAMMPGMLTDAQMKQLTDATGETFDSLFLTFMIQHHKGAIAMVKELFATPGAGQDELVFKFASDANVDQTTEISRMEQMLLLLTLQKP